MIIPDVNLLVYAHNTDAPRHSAAQGWLEQVVTGPDTVGIAWAAALGFVRLLSSPAVVPRPETPAALLESLSLLLAEPNVRVVTPGHRHVQIMARLCEDIGANYRLVTDIHLAALAIEHEATLASNDADFGRIPGLRWVNPIA